MARPWASSTWCEAASAECRSVSPGAWRPCRWPIMPEQNASFIVTQTGTHVAEAVQHELHVVAEVGHGVAVHPAAGVLQRLREVPVVQGGHGLDAPGAQPVHQAPVVVEALLVDRAGTVRDDPGPADREPVGVQAQAGHEIQVRVGPVIVVAGDRAGVAVRHGPRNLAERVPHRGSAAVFIGRALDLVRGRGHAKQETGREAHGHCRLLLHCASGMAMCGAVGTGSVDSLELMLSLE